MKRPEYSANINWRESQAKAERRWLSEYLTVPDPEATAPTDEDVPKCPHGVTGPWQYCTVCQPLVVRTPPRLEPYSVPFGQAPRGNLSYFPRLGVVYLSKRGAIGQIYYPGDHEISPYDPSYRMRTAEAAGGYKRSGAKDGNAVRAFRKPGVPWDGDGEELDDEPRGTGSFAAFPRPDEYEREDLIWFRGPRANPIHRPEWHHITGEMFFAEVGRLSRWSDFTERPHPEMELTPSGRVRHKDPIRAGLAIDAEKDLWFYRRRRPRVLYLFTIPPFEGDEERWQKKYWHHRIPYVQQFRKPCAEGWREERKMRDLDARLKLYAWGSHNELRDVRQMLTTTRARAWAAWLEIRRPVQCPRPTFKTKPREYEDDRPLRRGRSPRRETVLPSPPHAPYPAEFLQRWKQRAPWRAGSY